MEEATVEGTPPVTPAAAGGTGLVVIGASAGGLASMQAVVSRLPADFPWPVLVVQHSDPRRESHLPEILGRGAALDLRILVEGDRLVRGRVYVCPSGMTARIAPDGSVGLQVVAGPPPRTVTTTLVTAAQAYGDRTIAVILSGTGNDGSAGAMEIKRRGGMVVAESEASAAHFGMPKAAIHAGAVDAVLAADEIAEVVVSIVRGEYEETRPAEEAAIAGILEFVKRTRGTLLDQYRPTTIRRRLRRHIFLHGFTSNADYLAALEAEPDGIDTLFDTLLINVSGFFRDPDAFAFLEEHVVPALVRRVGEGRPIRVWSAGCGTGEEPYSLAILLAEALDPANWSNVKIFATDLDTKAIEDARTGTYPEAKLEGLSLQRRERFFVETAAGFELKKPLRRMVVFGVHDLTKDAPIANVDLIVCRNVLIYFDVPMQGRVLESFDFCAAPDGFLFLGRSEALSGDIAFEPLDRRLRIFQKRGRPGGGRPRAPRASRHEAQPAADRDPGIALRLVDHLLEYAGLILIVLGPKGEVEYANRHARQFAANRDGTPDSDLERTFPFLHQPKVTEAISDARDSGRRVQHAALPCTHRGRRVAIDLTVGPIEGTPGHVLLLGEDVTTQDELRRGLKARGLALQESVEDLQVANEELQAANEELETTNEELQSTNEELTTLNEEIQSTNEELETTNEELQSTNEQLDSANAALARTSEAVAWAEHLLRTAADAAGDAVVVLDADQSIVLWSRRAREVFGEAEDEVVARNVFATRLHLVGSPLREALLASAESATTVTIPEARFLVAGGGERHLRLQARPLRRPDGAPGGWILTASDLSSATALARDAEAWKARYAAVLSGTDEGVLAVDRDGTIRDPNPRAVDLLTRGRTSGLPTHIWEVTQDVRTIFEIKGALADLARGPGRKAETHAVEVAFEDGRSITLTFVALDAADLAPVVIVRPGRDGARNA